MSTDVDQAYFAWSQEQLTQRDGSTGVSVSQMLDHGSVSFGKFEFESLSWEKWSVFTHDRRQEELEKFNGLVAEKKAYFEEYYKKLRALKALQQQQEQASQQIRSENLRTELTLEYSIDGSISEEEEEKAETKMEIKTEMEIKEEMKDEKEENLVEKEDLEEKGRLDSKKPMERKAITKGASSSNGPQKGLKLKTKPETHPTSRHQKPITRPGTQKPRPPPPPPPQRTIRKVNPTNIKVKPKEPSRTIPSASTITRATRSTAATSTNMGTNLKRPSSSGGPTMRRPMSSGGARPSGTPKRPLSSAGVREKESRTREKVQPKSDLRSIRAGGPSLHNTPRMAIIPSMVKSSTTETKRETRKLVKEPLALNNNTTSVKRAQVYSHETSKSRSLNLPSKKNTDSTNLGLNKDTTQSRLSVARNNPQPACNNASMRNATTARTVTNNRTESCKPIAPRNSERPQTGTRPQTSSSSVNARKPRAEAQKWR